MTNPSTATKSAIDKMFCIMRVVNDSNEPMTINQISTRTWVNPRTVQRHAMRLANEGLINIRTSRKHAGGYEYYRNGLRVQP